MCALVPHPPLPSPTWAKLATIVTVVPGVQKVVGRQCALEDCRTPHSTATSRTFARCLWAQPLSSLWLELQGLTRYRGHFA